MKPTDKDRFPLHVPSGKVRFNPEVLPEEYISRLSSATAEGQAKHYLMPGKVFASATPFAVTTILGSGVAVCIWDAHKKIGGANHFLWPFNLGDGPVDAKYAETANADLLHQLLNLGANLNDMEAKIYGGSLPVGASGKSTENLGKQNVEVALSFLESKGIRVKANETGNTRGRKLIFQTHDGAAWVQQL
jgi:chemotaxis protein CheD